MNCNKRMTHITYIDGSNLYNCEMLFDRPTQEKKTANTNDFSSYFELLNIDCYGILHKKFCQGLLTIVFSGD